MQSPDAKSKADEDRNCVENDEAQMPFDVQRDATVRNAHEVLRLDVWPHNRGFCMKFGKKTDENGHFMFFSDIFNHWTDRNATLQEALSVRRTVGPSVCQVFLEKWGFR